uniref:Lipocalin n=1 Tax=Rhipicephalus zambeziensis TaxID=60191 RepID=A0A224YL00_9ACAR
MELLRLCLMLCIFMPALVADLESVVIPPSCLQAKLSFNPSTWASLYKCNTTLFLHGAVPSTLFLISSIVESQCHLFTTLFKSVRNLVVLSIFALLVYYGILLFERLFSFKMCSYFRIPIYGF